MVRDIRAVLRAVVGDDEGGVLIEYILLMVLITMAAIIGMTFLGRTSSNRMNNIGAAVDSV